MENYFAFIECHDKNHMIEENDHFTSYEMQRSSRKEFYVDFSLSSKNFRERN